MAGAVPVDWVRVDVELRRSSRWHQRILVTLLALASLLLWSSIAQASSHPVTVQTPRQLTQVLTQGVELKNLPATVVSLANIDSDEPDTHGCLIDASSTDPISQRPPSATCTFGDIKAKATIVLFGDSQADMWMSALSRYGTEYHFRVIEFTLGNCDTASLHLWNNTTEAPGKACTSFRAWAISQINGLHPAAVILSNFPNRTNYQDQEVSKHDYAKGIEATLKDLSSPGRKLVLLGRIPESTGEPAECLAAYSHDVERCNVSLKATEPSEYLSVLSEAAHAEHATLIETNSWMCAGSVCPVVANDTILYRNQYHVSNHWVTEIAPIIDTALRTVLK
jgi:hypothetical protein